MIERKLLFFSLDRQTCSQALFTSRIGVSLHIPYSQSAQSFQPEAFRVLNPKACPVCSTTNSIIQSAGPCMCASSRIQILLPRHSRSIPHNNFILLSPSSKSWLVPPLASNCLQARSTTNIPHQGSQQAAPKNRDQFIREAMPSASHSQSIEVRMRFAALMRVSPSQ